MNTTENNSNSIPWEKLLANVDRWRNPSDMEGLRFTADCADRLTANPNRFGPLMFDACIAASMNIFCYFATFRDYVERRI